MEVCFTTEPFINSVVVWTDSEVDASKMFSLSVLPCLELKATVKQP